MDLTGMDLKNSKRQEREKRRGRNHGKRRLGPQQESKGRAGRPSKTPGKAKDWTGEPDRLKRAKGKRPRSGSRGRYPKQAEHTDQSSPSKRRLQACITPITQQHGSHAPESECTRSSWRPALPRRCPAVQGALSVCNLVFSRLGQHLYAIQVQGCSIQLQAAIIVTMLHSSCAQQTKCAEQGHPAASWVEVLQLHT
jgi:hypothetical protein